VTFVSQGQARRTALPGTESNEAEVPGKVPAKVLVPIVQVGREDADFVAYRNIPSPASALRVEHKIRKRNWFQRNIWDYKK